MHAYGEEWIKHDSRRRRHLAEIFALNGKEERFCDIDGYDPVSKDREPSEHRELARALPFPPDPP
ncbi:MAG: hypothetical protein ACXW2H_09080 [Candidatus Aminicenantales bacterium]